MSSISEIENTLDFAKESLVLEVTEKICELMQAENMCRVGLAKKMRCSKAHITRMLNGSRNMTLGTVAEVMFAIGYEVTLKYKKRKSRLGL
jgi:DNA-binding phage protein